MNIHKLSMSNKLTPRQIGQKIARIRKQKGLSQEELAKHTGISRSSFAQIELGNRNLNVFEFQVIAKVLGFSMDEFMSSQYFITEQPNLVLAERTLVYGERVSKPILQKHKIQDILIHLLEKCAGKPNIGESMLYNLLYFLDFNHYELYETQLTGMTYKKRSFGPFPFEWASIIAQMKKKNLIQQIKTNYLGLAHSRYIPLAKADLGKLKASEMNVMDRVFDQFSDWSAETLSSYISGDMPIITTKEGEVIDYELVFYREPPYSVRNYDSLNNTEG